MSDEVGDVCSLLEVIETEQVVEILEESQFLDLSPLETRGEIPAAGASAILARGDEPAAAVEMEGTQLAGQKRKRAYACKTPNIHNIQTLLFTPTTSFFLSFSSECSNDLQEAGMFGVPLPTAVVPPSPRQATLPPPPPPPKSLPPPPTPHQTSETATTLQLASTTSPATPSPLLLPGI